MAKLKVKQIMQTTIAALIGVQSDKNRKRDFTQGSAYHFIIAGLIGTALFILMLAFIVSLVTPA